MVSMPRRQKDALESRCALLEQALVEAIPSDRERTRLLEHLKSAGEREAQDFDEVEQDIADDSHNVREGRILQDPDGTVRYLGESSGATFLNHLREYMATVFPLTFDSAWPDHSNPDTAFISALGKYQTHDSRPLLASNVDPFILPSHQEAIEMLTELRYSAQDGDGTFPSGGIYYWFSARSLMSDYQNYLDSSGALDSNPHMVTANAAFAVACQFNPLCVPEWESGSGQTFFARAKLSIGNPLEVSVLNDASVLALLGFYLLNNNRRDAAYIYISVAMHILIVHGVHRAWLVDEQGKRFFWTVYILDSDLPPAAGLRAHVELSRISNYIVSNIYDISRQNDVPAKTTLCIHKAMAFLEAWHQKLPSAVQSTEENLACDRSVGELHMARNQLIILSVRPLLFIAVKKITADMLLNGKTASQEISYQGELDLCSEAARRNVMLWHRLLKLPRPARLSHPSIHYLFNAALTLQLYQILVEVPAQGDYDKIDFVISALHADVSTNQEYSKDCANVLTDLSSLTGRLQRVDLSQAAARGETSHDHADSDQPFSSAISSPTENTPINSSTAPVGHGGRRRGTNGESHAARASNAPFDRRESAYNELLSWLQTDELQQKFDFPHRLGQNIA